MPTNLENEYLRKHNQSGLKVGDIVKVTRKAENNELGWRNCWIKLKDEWIGKHVKIHADHGQEGFEIDDRILRFEYGYYHAPYFILSKEEIEFTTIKKIPITISNQEFMLPQCIADLCKTNIKKDKKQ